MKCINCNVELPDGAKVCPMCGAKATTAVVRCPECFVKLEKGTEICPKCGCNIKKAINEEKNIPQEKAGITKKQMAAAIVSAVVVISVIAAAVGIWRSYKFKIFKEEADTFVSELEESIDQITVLAGEYNKVYDGQWLVHTENSLSLEKKYSEEIEKLKDSRDTCTYLASDLAGKSINDKDAALVQTAFKDFDRCYVYVVGKKGKYPGYMSGYEKVLESYEKSIKELKKRIR